MAIEQNTGAINYPGTYKDPESGTELEVSTEPGADALARLGWKFVKEYISPRDQARLDEANAKSKSKKSAEVSQDPVEVEEKELKSTKKEKESK